MDIAQLRELFTTLANTDKLSLVKTEEPNVLCLEDVLAIAEEGLTILDGAAEPAHCQQHRDTGRGVCADCGTAL